MESQLTMNQADLSPGPLHFQYDRYGRPSRLWQGDVCVGRFVGVEAVPYDAIQIGQWGFGPYRLDGAGSGSPKMLKLAHPWADPPLTFSIPL
mgnify:CR=1 FL=1